MKKLSTLALIIFLAPAICSAAIGHVQTLAGGATCSGTSCGVTFASNSTAGNMIAVCWRHGTGNDGSTITITDSRSSSYTGNAVQAIDTVDNSRNGIGYTSSVPTTGANTVTVAKTGSSATMRVSASEFSGAATSGALDKTATAIGSGTTPASGAVTPDTNGELLYACTHNSTNGISFTAGTDFTIPTTVPTPSDQRMATEYYIQPTAASHDGNFTMSNTDTWGDVLATFRPPVAAAAATYKPQSVFFDDSSV